MVEICQIYLYMSGRDQLNTIARLTLTTTFIDRWNMNFVLAATWNWHASNLPLWAVVTEGLGNAWSEILMTVEDDKSIRHLRMYVVVSQAIGES